MSLQQVFERIAFSAENGGFIQQDKELIMGSIENLYTNSAIARTVLESLISSDKILTFENNLHYGNTGSFSTTTIEIDFEQIEYLYIIDDVGKTHSFTLDRVIAHEMMHAIANEDDPRLTSFTIPESDYVGEAVGWENAIMEEMGDTFHRNSYYSVIDAFDLSSQLGLSLGEDISVGTPFTLAIVDTEVYNAIDVSDRADACLLIGLEGNDHIRGGAGDDVIYGGDDDDIIAGGSGSDWIIGGAGSDTIIGGSITSFDDFSTAIDHPEWSDLTPDYLSGGEGMDTYFTRGSSEIAGGRASGRFWSYEVYRDTINDSDFDLYAQFTVDGQLNTAHITGDMIEAGVADPLDDYFGTITVQAEAGSMLAQLRGAFHNGSYIVWADWYEGEMASMLARFDYETI